MNTKVYIIITQGYDGPIYYGCFSTRQKAEDFIEKANSLTYVGVFSTREKAEEKLNYFKTNYYSIFEIIEEELDDPNI